MKLYLILLDTIMLMWCLPAYYSHFTKWNCMARLESSITSHTLWGYKLYEGNVQSLNYSERLYFKKLVILVIWYTITELKKTKIFTSEYFIMDIRTISLMEMEGFANCRIWWFWILVLNLHSDIESPDAGFIISDTVFYIVTRSRGVYYIKLSTRNIQTKI